LQTIGSTLLENWNGIEKSYRPTCKKIISFAFTHDIFDEAQLAEKLMTAYEYFFQTSFLSESVRSLVNANILSNIGDGTYTLHSKVEQEYLAANLHKLL
jgi:hypothetical protein